MGSKNSATCLLAREMCSQRIQKSNVNSNSEKQTDTRTDVELENRRVDVRKLRR